MKLYTIYTRRDNIAIDAPLRDLAIDLSISGGSIKYDLEYNYYYVEPVFLTDDLVEQLEQVPNTKVFYFELEPGGDIKGYYVAVEDLAQELDPSLPGSSVTDEEGNTRQLTYQEIEDMPTVSTPVRVDGKYYFETTAQIGFIGLTMDEFKNIAVPLVWVDDLPELPNLEP